LSIQTVARRYAVALADVVIRNNEAREVQEELIAWEQILHSNDQLLEVFGNPTIPYDQKDKVLNALIKKTKIRITTANFLKVLLKNHRLIDLKEINKRFVAELDQRFGMVSAQVTTARPVPESSQEVLRAKISEITGSRVRVQFAVDESLIGGVVTRIGSTIYDGSVRGQLQRIKETLGGDHGSYVAGSIN
jgi:F-type H+-transporting ATPase subunit delta